MATSVNLTTLIKRYARTLEPSLVCYQYSSILPFPISSLSTHLPSKMPSTLPAKLALTILGRLEAATSRLEDLVPTIGDPSLTTNGAQPLSGQSPSADQALDQARSPSRHMETLPPVIDDFDAIINGQVKSFVNMSEEIGGLVAEQVFPPKVCHHGSIWHADPWITSLLLSFEPLLPSVNSSLLPQKPGSRISSRQSIWRS